MSGEGCFTVNTIDEGKDFSSEKRRILRQEKSVPILDEFKTWLEETKEKVLPKSPMGQAVQ